MAVAEQGVSLGDGFVLSGLYNLPGSRQSVTWAAIVVRFLIPDLDKCSLEL